MVQEWMQIMQNADIRKALGARIKDLRKRRRWTQKELAAKLGVQFAHLNKYEMGLHAPPLDKLVRLAEIFETTVDYLLLGDLAERPAIENTRLFERFKALGEFEPADQETVITLIDAMIVKRRVEGAVRPLERRRSTATG